MEIGKVIGQVVSTVKDEALPKTSLLLVEILQFDEKNKIEKQATQVAADTLGAGDGEWVLLVRGSSARMAGNFPKSPIDLYIVGIIDNIIANKKPLYEK